MSETQPDKAPELLRLWIYNNCDAPRLAGSSGDCKACGVIERIEFEYSRVRVPSGEQKVDVTAIAHDIADRWARHDLPLRSAILSNPTLQLKALAEYVISNRLCAASFIRAAVSADTTRVALAHAKQLNPETETVFTDSQETWYGARLDNHPTTGAFEVCATCRQVNAHEDECPEGYHPLAVATAPQDIQKPSLKDHALKLINEIRECRTCPICEHCQLILFDELEGLLKIVEMKLPEKLK